ncbi:MAG: hypothetical protein ACRYHQ_24240, partial [Janthinobacterium lividum]
DVVGYQGSGPFFNGGLFDGSEYFNSGATAQYGLFDVTVGYNLLSGSSVADFETEVKALVSSLRAAGTQLRAFSLGSTAFPADAIQQPTDLVDSLLWGQAWTFDGSYQFDGSISFDVGEMHTGSIDGTLAGTVTVGTLPTISAAVQAAAAATVDDVLELEQGGALLNEDGSYLQLEG